MYRIVSVIGISPQTNTTIFLVLKLVHSTFCKTIACFCAVLCSHDLSIDRLLVIIFAKMYVCSYFLFVVAHPLAQD